MLLNTKVFATTQVRQSSMQDTLFEGQHLFIEKLSYDFGNPSRGDIIVFIENNHPQNYLDGIKIFLTDISEVFKPTDEKTDVRLVKRVIGLPGDKVDVRDGSVYVNGKKLDEAYTKGQTYTREFAFPVKVPVGKYIVMGDNREVSKDSRSFGLIERCQIEGKATARFWPLNKIGGLK
jgi:signal peptidase I